MLAVAGPDVPKAQSILQAQWQGLLDEEDAGRDIVVDFNQARMTCPACLHEFDTGPSECPDCGLFLG